MTAAPRCRVSLGRRRPLFTTSTETPIGAAVVTRAFLRALERPGLPRRRCQDLRPAAADDYKWVAEV